MPWQNFANYCRHVASAGVAHEVGAEPTMKTGGYEDRTVGEFVSDEASRQAA
jgi:hypothetical protein